MRKSRLDQLILKFEPALVSYIIRSDQLLYSEKNLPMKFDFLTMILNRAGLYTDAEYAVTKARGKVQELKNLKNKLESETQRQMVMPQKESTAIQSNENLNGECSFTLQLFHFLSLSLSNIGIHIPLKLCLPHKRNKS